MDSTVFGHLLLLFFFVLETHQGECKASNKSPRFSKPVVDLKQKTRRGKVRKRERGGEKESVLCYHGPGPFSHYH